jgi:hypothetical protein
MRRLCRRHRCALVAAGVLAVVPAALADKPPPVPWAGGAAVVSPLEAFAASLASRIAGRTVQVICNGSGEWSQLSAEQKFDPVTVWGFVVFNWDEASQAYVPADYMQLSEAACFYLDEYWRAPAAQKGKRCVVQTRVTFVQKKTRLRVIMRVKVKGRWVKRPGWITQVTQVPVSHSTYEECPDYDNRVFALQTLSHESQHLAGVRDEATAECQGMQKLPWFAEQFGATPAQARQMAVDYFTRFYEVKRPGTPYYDPTCPDPGK